MDWQYCPLRTFHYVFFKGGENLEKRKTLAKITELKIDKKNFIIASAVKYLVPPNL